MLQDYLAHDIQITPLFQLIVTFLGFVEFWTLVWLVEALLHISFLIDVSPINFLLEIIQQLRDYVILALLVIHVLQFFKLYWTIIPRPTLIQLINLTIPHFQKITIQILRKLVVITTTRSSIFWWRQLLHIFLFRSDWFGIFLLLDFPLCFCLPFL
jgi:hypothetical protein